MTTAEPMLRIDGLTKRFGGLTAVDTLSFTADRDEIVGFIGPNGSGKTTVFNCIMSVYRATDGAIYFNGEDITDADTHDIVNSGLARVSQESNPVPGYTVAENIEMFTYPNSVLSLVGGASPEEVADIARQFDLGDSLDELPDSLPHAAVRKLEIAKAVATDPEMLLLDEPFAGMNQSEIRSLSGKIRELHEDGIGFVVVDHNMSGLMQLVDRVVVLYSGQKLAEGTPEEIAEDTQVREAYLASTEVHIDE